jgi:preprotein translocase subunit YajC
MANTSFVVFAQAADGSVSATAAAPAAETASTTQADASASELGQQQALPPSNTMMMVPIIIVFVVMIAISMRTSSKEKKKREEMMNSIRKGTKIMTSGGILGEIAEVQKDQFLLKVANNVQIAISRSAVAQVIQPAADAADTKAEVTKK